MLKKEIMQKSKRWMKSSLAFILAVAVTISMAPMQSFATGEDLHVHEDELVTEEHIHTEDCIHEEDSDTGTDEDLVINEDLVVDSEDPTIPGDILIEETADLPVVDDVVIEELDSPVEEENTPQVDVNSEDIASGYLEEVQSDMDAILEKFGIEIGMTEEEISWVIQTSNYPNNPMEDYAALEAKAANLTEAELAQLETYESTETFGRFYDVLDQMMNPMPITTVTVLDGQVSITDTANKNTVSGDVVTIKASASWWSSSTNSITITNNTERKISLAFSYGASNQSGVNIAGNTASSGTYSGVINAGGSISGSISVKASGISTSTATLTLSNFSITEVKENSNVTFVYDHTLGSMAAAGTLIDSGTTQSVSLANGIALTATPNSGVTFLGWINKETGAILSTATSYTLVPAVDMSVEAAFASAASNAWFEVPGAGLYNDLSIAVTKGTKVTAMLRSL